MEQSVNARVLMLKTQLGLTDIEFCGRSSISTGTFNKIKNEEEVSQRVLNSIIAGLNVNREWLLYGKGKMLKELQGSFDPARDTLYKDLKEEINFYRELLKQVAGGKANFLRTFNETALRPTGS